MALYLTPSPSREQTAQEDCRTIMSYFSLFPGDHTEDEIMKYCDLSERRWHSARISLLDKKKIGTVLGSQNQEKKYCLLNIER